MSDWLYGRRRAPRTRRIWRSVVMTILVMATVLVLGKITGGSSGTDASRTGDAAPTRTTAPPPPAFAPISVQTEDPGNTLFGGAGVVDCATCDGGARVRYIIGVNRVVVRATANVAGTRTVTVVYETDVPRLLKVSINDGLPYVTTVDGTSWEAPRRLTFTATIPAGEVNVALFNEEGAAPDVDKVTIT
ncbi:hypothetical protein [Dactylosporangium sp. CA-233914]|uniref:hypothetical protein n=1 Tax=Dactylosporangium sp. CA-233914 TaxID=3239934 RepID=UPI003D948516